MKNILRLLALIVVLAAVSTWLTTGASRGWTKTSVAQKTVDEVTGLEGITYEQRFVAGVDFLVAGLAGAGLLAGASLFFRKPSTTTVH
jgi:hypothetical protein